MKNKVMVKDILNLDYFKDHKLIAGEKGLRNLVQHATIFEARETHWLPSNTFLATTAQQFSQNPEDLIYWFYDLIAAKIAAISIKTGRYIENIPQAVLQLCNEQNIPLLISPCHANPTEFTSSILTLLISTTDKYVNAGYERQTANLITRALLYSSLTSEEQSELHIEADVLNCHFDKPYYIFLIPTQSVAHDSQIALFHLIGTQLMSHDPLSFGSILPKHFIYLCHPRHPDKDYYHMEDGIKTLAFKVAGILSTYDTTLFVSNRAKGLSMFGRTNHDIISYAKFYQAVQARHHYRPVFYNSTDNVYFAKVLFENKSASKYIVDSQLYSPLSGLSKPQKEEILNTLRAYLQENGKIQKIAEYLHVHNNTVSYRIRSIEKLFDCDLREMRTRTSLWIAMMLHDAFISENTDSSEE